MKDTVPTQAGAGLLKDLLQAVLPPHTPQATHHGAALTGLAWGRLASPALTAWWAVWWALTAWWAVWWALTASCEARQGCLLTAKSGQVWKCCPHSMVW